MYLLIYNKKQKHSAISPLRKVQIRLSLIAEVVPTKWLCYSSNYV